MGESSRMALYVSVLMPLLLLSVTLAGRASAFDSLSVHEDDARVEWVYAPPSTQTVAVSFMMSVRDPSATGRVVRGEDALGETWACDLTAGSGTRLECGFPRVFSSSSVAIDVHAGAPVSVTFALNLSDGTMALYADGMVRDVVYGGGGQPDLLETSIRTGGGDGHVGAGVAVAALRVQHDLTGVSELFRDAFCIDEADDEWESTLVFLAPLQGGTAERYGAAEVVDGTLLFVNVPHVVPSGRECVWRSAEPLAPNAEVTVSVNEQRVNRYVFAYAQLHSSYEGVSIAWVMDGQVVSTDEVLVVLPSAAERSEVTCTITGSDGSVAVHTIVLESFAPIESLGFPFAANATVTPSGVPMFLFVVASSDIGYGRFEWDFNDDGVFDAVTNTPSVTHDFGGGNATVVCRLCNPWECATTNVQLGDSVGDVVLPGNSDVVFPISVGAGWVDGSTQFKVHVGSAPLASQRFLTLRSHTHGETTWCDLTTAGALHCGIRDHSSNSKWFQFSGALSAGTHDVILAYTYQSVLMYVDGNEVFSTTHEVVSLGGVDEVAISPVTPAFHVGEVRVWASAHNDGSYIDCAPHPHLGDLVFYAPRRYHEVNIKYLLPAQVNAAPASYDAFSDVAPCTCTPSCSNQCNGGLDGCGGRCPGDWWGCPEPYMCNQDAGQCADPFCSADGSGCPSDFYCTDPANAGIPGSCVESMCITNGCVSGWCDLSGTCRQVTTVTPSWHQQSVPLGTFALDGAPSGAVVKLVHEGDTCADAGVVALATVGAEHLVDFGSEVIGSPGFYLWCLSLDGGSVFELQHAAPMLLVDTAEGTALYELYHRNPQAFPTWSFPASQETICGWPHVHCDGLDITELTIVSESVGGPIPDLSSLELSLLALRDCALTGTVPDWIFHSGLVTLDLRSNDLSGTLPEDGVINQASALQEMDVRHNSLTGSLPATLPSSLVLLAVQNNDFSGALPAYESLVNMQYFFARNNRLSGEVPQGWAAWSNAREIDLSRNDVSGTLQPFVAMRQLTHLEVGHNDIAGTISPEWDLNTALVAFSVGHNRISGTLPSLASLVNMQVFDVSTNELHGTVPDMFADMAVLDEIFLDRNMFIGELPSSLVQLGASQFDIASNEWWCPDTSSELPACVVSGCATGVDTPVCHAQNSGIITVEMRGAGDRSQAMGVPHAALSEPLQLWTEGWLGSFASRAFTLAALTTFDPNDGALVDPAEFDFGQYSYTNVSFSVDAEGGLPVPVFVRMHLYEAHQPRLYYYDTEESMWKVASAACTGAGDDADAPYERAEADPDVPGMVLVTKVCHLTQFAVLDTPPGEVVGDPHFAGLHGGTFDFTGEAGRTYCLISDERVQVNARMVHNAHGIAGTYMEELGVAVGSSRVRFHRSGSVWITPLTPVPGRARTYAVDGGRGTVHIDDHAVHVHAPPYTLELQRFLGKGVEDDPARAVDAAHVGLRVRVDARAVGAAWQPHGVYGQTFVMESVLVGRGPNGEGVIAGRPEDYAVSGLYASDFPHARWHVDGEAGDAGVRREADAVVAVDERGEPEEAPARLTVDVWTGAVW